jgi:multiple sugar transport system substrate-binding protein
MNKLELSLVGAAPEILRDVLVQLGFPCEIEKMTWGNAWAKLTETGLYRFGPDVSEIGTTWLEGIVATGSVRPFTDAEVDSMGGEAAFLPALWRTALLPWGGDKKVWAIPWLADTRLVFYWRDILEQAGIDERTAFSTPDSVEDTMIRLRASGGEAPWGVWVVGGGVALQNAASWVWQAGGGFLSANGRQILLDRPEAIEGFVSHLKLCRYLPPGVESIDTRRFDAEEAFAKRRIAVLMGLCGWFPSFLRQAEIPDAVDRLGMALPPGPAFVGGANLIVWQHARRMQDALALVRTLTGKPFWRACPHDLDFFPARLDMWAEPSYASDPRYEMVTQAIKTGRTFPVVSKWGMFENRLNQTVTELWERALADPDQDLTDLVSSYMRALAGRFAVSLGIRR